MLYQEPHEKTEDLYFGEAPDSGKMLIFLGNPCHFRAKKALYLGPHLTVISTAPQLENIA